MIVNVLKYFSFLGKESCIVHNFFDKIYYGEHEQREDAFLIPIVSTYPRTATELHETTPSS